MVKALLEIYRSDDAEDAAPWSWNLINNAEVIPSEGELVLIRSIGRGAHDAIALTARSVLPLASLDGYRIAFTLQTNPDGDPLFLAERQLRRDLLNLDWTRVGSPRPIDKAVDVDDYEGLEDF